MSLMARESWDPQAVGEGPERPRGVVIPLDVVAHLPELGLDGAAGPLGDEAQCLGGRHAHLVRAGQRVHRVGKLARDTLLAAELALGEQRERGHRDEERGDHEDYRREPGGIQEALPAQLGRPGGDDAADPESGERPRHQERVQGCPLEDGERRLEGFAEIPSPALPEVGGPLGLPLCRLRRRPVVPEDARNGPAQRLAGAQQEVPSHQRRQTADALARDVVLLVECDRCLRERRGQRVQQHEKECHRQRHHHVDQQRNLADSLCAQQAHDDEDDDEKEGAATNRTTNTSLSSESVSRKPVCSSRASWR